MEQDSNLHYIAPTFSTYRPMWFCQLNYPGIMGMGRHPLIYGNHTTSASVHAG